MNKQKGITLIALIVSIIVMLILVAVTVRIVTEGGLIDKARLAKDQTNQAMDNETNAVEDIVLDIDDANANDESDFSFDSVNGAIEEYTGSSTEVVIPNKIGGVLVTEIGSSAFADNTSITSVTISGNVETISGQAFRGCTSLETVYIPSSVTFIDYSAFDSTAFLEDLLDDGEGVAIYDNRVLLKVDDTNYTLGSNFTMPNTVELIAREAFNGCDFTSITLSSTLKYINAYAFHDCALLTSITIPSTVISIGTHAFNQCTNLTTITINKAENSISGAVWNAPNVGLSVVWNP